jgi:hypothetical protein
VPRQSSGSAEFTVDTRDFRELFARSSKVEPKLRTALRRRIRDAAKGVAEDVKAEALKPGEGVGTKAGWTPRIVRTTGLRQNIAGAVKVGILTGNSRSGVRITTNAPLAGAWQARRGWRHPVFGDRDTWVQQKGRPDFFYGTVWAGRDRVKAAVEEAMKEAADSLKGRS